MRETYNRSNGKNTWRTGETASGKSRGKNEEQVRVLKGSALEFIEEAWKHESGYTAHFANACLIDDTDTCE